MQGKSYNYSNPISAVADIVRSDGVAGLWKGVIPYVVRGALLTGTQLGVYDQSKQMVKTYLNLEDGVTAHVTAAMVAGVCTSKTPVKLPSKISSVSPDLSGCHNAVTPLPQEAKLSKLFFPHGLACDNNRLPASRHGEDPYDECSRGI